MVRDAAAACSAWQLVEDDNARCVAGLGHVEVRMKGFLSCMRSKLCHDFQLVLVSSS